MRLTPCQRAVPVVSALLLVACGDPATAPTVPGTTHAARAAATPHLVPSSLRYRDEGHHPATGRAGGASVTVRALLDRTGSTRFEAYAGDMGDDGPGELQKVQLKLFTGDGKHVGTLNFNGLAGRAAAMDVVGPARHAPYQVQAHVKGADGGRTGVVTVRDLVQRRPDLAVLSVGVPAMAWAHAPTFISAVVVERNGDVGARSACVLDVDGVPVDSAADIWVDAGGTVNCEFAHVFTSAGTYAVRARVVNAAPADDDASNDAATAVVAVHETVTMASSATVASDSLRETRATTEQFHAALMGYPMPFPRYWESRSETTTYTTYVQGARLDASTGAPVAFPEEPLRDVHLLMATAGITVHEAHFAALPADDLTVGPDRTTACLRRSSSGLVVTSFVVCSWRAPSTGATGTTLTYQWNAGDVTYHSSGSKATWCYAPLTCTPTSYEWNDVWHGTPTGTRVPFGSDFAIEAGFDSGLRRFSATQALALTAAHEATTYPRTCSVVPAYQGGWVGRLERCETLSRESWWLRGMTPGTVAAPILP